jgi:hypothetical protein
MKLRELIEMDQHQKMVDKNIKFHIKGQIESITEELRKLRNSIDTSEVISVHNLVSEIAKAQIILEGILKKL